MRRHPSVGACVGRALRCAGHSPLHGWSDDLGGCSDFDQHCSDSEQRSSESQQHGSQRQKHCSNSLQPCSDSEQICSNLEQIARFWSNLVLWNTIFVSKWQNGSPASESRLLRRPWNWACKSAEIVSAPGTPRRARRHSVKVIMARSFDPA